MGESRDVVRALGVYHRDGGLTQADRRRTLIETAEEVEFTADDFIVEEDNVVIISRDGWVKRQKEVKDVASTRVREGDQVMAVLPASTRATVVFFSSFGVAYSARVIDIPFAVAGGVRSRDQAAACLDAGADKVSINTAAIARPPRAAARQNARRP